MRDLRKQLTDSTRRKRRACLIAFLWTASHVAAPYGAVAVDAVMPPLPLAPSADVQANPFCEPTTVTPQTSLKLASGNSESGSTTHASSSVRLMPIGAAIGLQPIQGDQPRRIEKVAMTIQESGQTSVQENPLIASTHRDNPSLVEASVDASVIDPVSGAEPISTISAASAMPSIVVSNLAERGLMPVPRLDEVAPSADSRSAIQPASDLQPTIIHSNRRPTIVPHVIVPHVIESVETDDPSSSETESFQFSMTDGFDELPPDTSDDDQTETGKVRRDPLGQDSLGGFTGGPINVGLSDESLDFGNDSNRSFNVDESIVFDDDDGSLTVFDFGGEPNEQGRESELIEQDFVPEKTIPIVSHPVSAAEPTLQNQRYRSPVAVTSVPISLGRDDAATVHAVKTNVATLVERARDPSTSPAAVPVAVDAESTPLYLSLAQVRSLTIGGLVRDVQVADQNICQAFASGPNQLKLIGTGNGVTRLVVWASPDAKDSVDSSPRMRAFEIHVREEVAAGGGVALDRTTMLNQSIAQAFPSVDVVVQTRRGELVVSGACESEATAKKIVRMVRKTCSVPVHDELVVR